MTNNNWENNLPEIMGFKPQVSSSMFINEELPQEIVRTKKFIRDLLTQKDQEHKAELESIKKEIDMNRNEACDCTGAKFECEHWGFNQALDYSISILDSHINKLSN